MAKFVIVITAAILSATAAQAEPAKSAGTAGIEVSAKEPLVAGRTLYICDASDLTRRSFARQHGAMEFVKADKVAEKGRSWAAPRCMTSSEYYRLKQKLAKN